MLKENGVDEARNLMRQPKVNVITFAGIFWLLAGCVGLFFASTKFVEDANLRTNGVTTNGVVVSETKDYLTKGNTGEFSSVSERDYQSSSSQDRSTEYHVDYVFHTPDGEKITGKVESSFPSGMKPGDTVNIVYLPADPLVNNLQSRVAINFGYILFWSIGALMWLLFIAVPGIGLIYISFPRSTKDRP
jgi:hypothetical protein